MSTDKQKQLDNERYNNYLFIKSDCIGKDIKVKKLKDLLKTYNIPTTGYYFQGYVDNGLLVCKDKKKGIYSFPITDISFNQFVDVFKSIRNKTNIQQNKNNKNKSLCKVIEDQLAKEEDEIQKAIRLLLSTGKYKVLKLEQVEVVTYKDEWKECTIE